MTYWIKDEEEASNEYVLHLTSPDLFYYTARVKEDGCVDFHRYFNKDTASEGCDSIHLCDIDDEIARLQALKAEALKYFGKGWDFKP